MVECGTIACGNHSVKRYLILEESLRFLITRFRPKLVIVEMNFSYRNIKTYAILNQLQGAIRLICAQQGIELDMLDNNTSKKYVLGTTQFWNGEKYVGVTKQMMADGVASILCPDAVMPAEGEYDAFDAIAIGLAYYDHPIERVALPRKPELPKKSRRKAT